MKKKFEMFFILSTITVCLLLGCSIDDIHSPETCPEVYSEGQRDTIIQIKDAAKYDYKVYIDMETLENIIQMQFKEYGDDVRDAIIFHPDNKFYSASDIVDELIGNCCFEEY